VSLERLNLHSICTGLKEGVEIQSSGYYTLHGSLVYECLVLPSSTIIKSGFQTQCFFYDFLFFAQVAPLKHILKPIHPDVG
jgi:hypothetical protein